MAIWRFPHLGYHKGIATEQQPNGTSPDLDNVIPIESIDNRLRGGQRPGLQKLYSQQIGGASSPVIWEGSISVYDSNILYGSQREAFETDNNAIDTIYGVNWYSQSVLTTASYYIVAVRLKLYRVGSPGTITVSLRAEGGDYLPTGADLASGTIDGDTITTDTGGLWYTIKFTTSYLVSDATKYCAVIRATSGDASNKVAWRLSTGTDRYADGKSGTSSNSGSTWSVVSANYDFLFQTYGTTPQPSDKLFSKKLVSIGNNEVWYESSSGTMAELSAANNDIDCTVPLTATEAFQKLFIANGDKLKVADFVNSKITTASVGSHPPDFGTVLTDGTTGASMIVDYITSLSGACTIYGKRTTMDTFEDGSTVTGTDDDGNSISFTLNADEVSSPHWYDWTVFGDDSSFGVMPSEAYSVWQWRGRLGLSANPDEPNQWYLSRQFNPWQFVYDYSTYGAQTAVAGRDGDVANCGDAVQIGIGYSRDHCILACVNSFWVFFGDPAEGGTLDKLQGVGGILGNWAWCRDSTDNFYIVTTNGFFRITPNFGEFQNLLEEKYPDFIDDLAYNPSTHRVVLAYYKKYNGIIICRTTFATGAGTAWWYSLKTGGLFPISFNNNCGIFSAYSYDSTNPSFQDLVLGGTDGYLRYLDRSTKSDDAGAAGTVAIDAYFTLGPIQLSDDPDGVGTLSNIKCVLGGGASGGSQSDSDGVTVSIWAEETAEEVIEKLSANTTPKLARTFSGPGRTKGEKISGGVRGNYAGIRIGNSTAGESFAIEKITGTVQKRGRQN